MSVKIFGEYLGGVATRMRHGPSGREVETDPPVDNGGTGSAFSPTDLVATALGSCMMSVLALHARKAHLDLSGMKISVEKIMTASLPRKIAQLKVELQLPAGLTVEQRKTLREIAENCPVALSVADSIEIPLTLL